MFDDQAGQELEMARNTQGEVAMFDERDILLKAASIVEEGWCQGAYHRRADGTWEGMNLQGQETVTLRPAAVTSCARGAILRARHELGLPRPPYGQSAADLLKGSVGPIIDWNDAPGRTADEVAEAMRTAALT